MNANKQELSTHEKLKLICDKINFVPKYEYTEFECDKGYGVILSGIEGYDCLHKVDEREIIFTQEFMDKFRKYIGEKYDFSTAYEKTSKLDLILVNLYNPTEYLYNLIK